MDGYPLHPAYDWTLEEADELIQKNYNLFRRERPSVPMGSTPDWVPPELSDVDFERDALYLVEKPWDQEFPSEFENLIGTLVTSYRGPLERPTYNRYFERVGQERISCPEGSLAVFSPLNLELPWPLELPPGWGYVSKIEEPMEGFVYIVPKSFLTDWSTPTLVLSNSKIKCEYYYKITPAFQAQPIYLSVVRPTSRSLAGYSGTSVRPLAVSYSNGEEFPDLVRDLAQYWVSVGLIPDPSLYTLSTGRCLSFEYIDVENAFGVAS